MTAVRRLDPSATRRAPGTSMLDDIAEVIGDEAATRLATAFAGARIYVPAAPGPDHPISQAIGHPAALLLADAYHQTEIVLPVRVAARARIVALHDAGHGPAEIQRQLRCSRSFVYQVLGERRGGGHTGGWRDDPRQINLFGED